MASTGKRIGFLSFGHWQRVPGSQVLTARDALVQTVELAVAAEELGLDGAYVRVHHAHLLDTIVRHVAPAIGWVPPQER